MSSKSERRISQKWSWEGPLVWDVLFSSFDFAKVSASVRFLSGSEGDGIWGPTGGGAYNHNLAFFNPIFFVGDFIQFLLGSRNLFSKDFWGYHLMNRVRVPNQGPLLLLVIASYDYIAFRFIKSRGPKKVHPSPTPM